jgi:hypothetical protein
MAEDIDNELADIMGAYRVRTAEKQQKVVAAEAAIQAFSLAWQECVRKVISPALTEMQTRLNKQQIVAHPGSFDQGIAMYIAARDARLHHGAGMDGQPYLAIVPNYQAQRVHFERNASGNGRGSGVGDFTPAEITTELIQGRVMGLIRELFGTVK